MAATTSIHITWSGIADMQHRISGQVLAPPRDDQLAWILSPSAPLLLSHQFGVMKPSHGLIVAGWITDMLFRDRYVLMPINPALSSARLDWHFTGGPSVKITFHPEHALLANSESLEEGVRQLINNFTHYVYAQLDEYLAIVHRTLAAAAIASYYEFLREQIGEGKIGRNEDKWSVEFSQLAATLIQNGTEMYYVPAGGRTRENDKWARKQTKHLEGVLGELDGAREPLLRGMGLK